MSDENTSFVDTLSKDTRGDLNPNMTYNPIDESSCPKSSLILKYYFDNRG